MIPEQWIIDAQSRIDDHIRNTPIIHDQNIGAFLKCENRQRTGSFKLRGALNKVIGLHDWEITPGLVTASAGNHGLGVALAAQIVGTSATVFVSKDAVPMKVDTIRSYNADVKYISGTYGEVETAGIDYAKLSGRTWISPYNDGQVIAGQATITTETITQNPSLLEATWVVPVGGGGLISGIASALHMLTANRVNSNTNPPKIIGSQSVASPFMHAIYYQGTQDNILESPSLADGLAGPVERNSITIPLVKKLVDQIVLVSEEEIKSAIHYAWHNFGEKIEASAATALAAIIGHHIEVNPPYVIILSGGNIQPDLHEKIINEPLWT